MTNKTTDDCLFCKIVKGELTSSVIYEDTDFLAILDLFPGTKGQTVLISKEHLDSSFTSISQNVLTALVIKAQHIAKVLEKSLSVKKVGFVIEGLQVAHLHAKLYPFPNLNADGSGSFSLTRSGEMANRSELDGLAGVVRETNVF